MNELTQWGCLTPGEARLADAFLERTCPDDPGRNSLAGVIEPERQYTDPDRYTMPGYQPGWAPNP